LASDLAEWLAEGAPDSVKCVIEDWRIKTRGVYYWLNGTTSCERGKLSFSMYDGDSGDFLESSFHYFDGFVFDATTDLTTVPKNLKLKYVIEE
jgi:hypothetical protein